MLMVVKGLFGCGVSMPTPVFVLWSGPMGAHGLKTSHVRYRY